MPSSRAARPRSTRRWDSIGALCPTAYGTRSHTATTYIPYPHILLVLYFCLTQTTSYVPDVLILISTSTLHLYCSTTLLDYSLTLPYLPARLLYPVLPLGGGLGRAAQGRTQGLEANAGIGRWIAHLSSFPPPPQFPPVNIHPSTPRSTRQYPSIHIHPSTNLPTSLVPPIHTQAPDGRPYWYNAATGETSWQPPGGGPGPTLQLEGSSVELLQVCASTQHPLG